MTFHGLTIHADHGFFRECFFNFDQWINSADIASGQYLARSC